MSKKEPLTEPSRKIFVVGPPGDYINWMEGKLVQDMDLADFVVFTGGEDVSPSLYERDKNPFTHCSPSRDANEVTAFRMALKLKKPMVGICRGAQFLCVMSGGILVQHQENPNYMHIMNTIRDGDIWVSSTHHQAQFPWVLPVAQFKVLGWTKGLSKFHYGQTDASDMAEWDLGGGKEVEVAYYEKTNCLCIQSHPEYYYDTRFERIELGDSIEYFQELLNEFLCGLLST